MTILELPATSTSMSLRGSHESSPLASPRLLVVDDEPAVSRTFKTLERQGIAVEAADTCTRAIELLRTRAFAAAFVDWKLRGEDGLAIIRAANDERIPTRLVVITGYADPDCSAEALRLGAGYLVKPVRMSLVAAITREAAEHGASTKFAEDAIFAGPPHERVAKAILKVVEAPNDVLTIDAWAELTGPARRTMEGWCSAAGVTAHNGLLFARCLRGVLRLSVFGEPFSQSIDSVDRRTRLELVEMAGGDRRSGAVPVTVEDFLEKQRVLGLATILNAVRRLLVDRYPNLR